MTKEERPLFIKDLAEEDRPREKLLSKGKEALSNAELLAILLGIGSVHDSALSLAQKILMSVDHDLNDLSKKTVKDLSKFKGIGSAKAITIIAAMELSRRRLQTHSKEKKQITCSKDAYHILYPRMQDLTIEEFWILIMNRNNRVEDQILISSGGVAGTVVDAKVIFKHALDSLASSMILAHNHPSGNLKPSQADIMLTHKLVAAGKSLDIKVVDHIIISSRGYYSFMDEGII